MSRDMARHLDYVRRNRMGCICRECSRMVGRRIATGQDGDAQFSACSETAAGVYGSCALCAAGDYSCSRYRYHLTRKIADKPGTCAFVMLNPSTADHQQLDPTVRRCIGYARDWGYGTLEVVNLYALRATAPTRLLEDKPAAVGRRNRDALVEVVSSADLIVCAWGTFVDRMRDAWWQLAVDAMVEAGASLKCLAVTMDGHPRHPLYLRKGLTPVDWDWSKPPANDGRGRTTWLERST